MLQQVLQVILMDTRMEHLLEAAISQTSLMRGSSGCLIHLELPRNLPGTICFGGSGVKSWYWYF